MHYTVQLYDNGRILIPADLRKKWNLQPGQDLILEEADGVATLTTRKQALQNLKQEIKASLPEGVSLVEQLKEERRLAAAQE